MDRANALQFACFVWAFILGCLWGLWCSRRRIDFCPCGLQRAERLTMGPCPRCAARDHSEGGEG